FEVNSFPAFKVNPQAGCPSLLDIRLKRLNTSNGIILNPIVGFWCHNPKRKITDEKDFVAILRVAIDTDANLARRECVNHYSGPRC
ncbi:MAG: hypothetical protein ABIP71_09935, partial [Verrucomicrobiota bacterium]